MFELSEFFGFDGCIDRIGYVSRGAVVATVLCAVAVGGERFLDYALNGGSLFGIRTWAEWGAYTLLALAAWAALGLTSRRLRGMGAEPAWVVPIYGFLCSAGVGLDERWLRIAPSPYNSIETVALLLLGLTAAPLLIWPSRPRPPALPPFAVFDPGGHTAYVNWRENAAP